MRGKHLCCTVPTDDTPDIPPMCKCFLSSRLYVSLRINNIMKFGVHEYGVSIKKQFCKTMLPLFCRQCWNSLAFFRILHFWAFHISYAITYTRFMDDCKVFMSCLENWREASRESQLRSPSTVFVYVQRWEGHSGDPKTHISSCRKACF